MGLLNSLFFCLSLPLCSFSSPFLSPYVSLHDSFSLVISFDSLDFVKSTLLGESLRYAMNTPEVQAELCNS